MLRIPASKLCREQSFSPKTGFLDLAVGGVLTLTLTLAKKNRPLERFFKFGGGPGIRTPGTSRFNGFQDRRFRPLSQPTEDLAA